MLDFSHLKGQELEKWVAQRGKKLGLKWERGAVDYLIQRTGQGLERIEMELQKLVAYVGSKGQVGRGEINLLVPESRESRVFALTDAVLARNREQSLYVWKSS